MKKVIMLFIAVIILTLAVTAHPGKTDSKGGHYDRQNGGYHYHHGYPAHKHTNGECPYDYDTQTQESEKEPSTKETSSKNNTSQSTNTISKKHTGKNKYNVFVYILSFVAAFFLIYGIPLVLVFRQEIKYFFKKLYCCIRDFLYEYKVIIGLIIGFVLLCMLIHFLDNETKDIPETTKSVVYYGEDFPRLTYPSFGDSYEKPTFDLSWMEPIEKK